MQGAQVQAWPSGRRIGVMVGFVVLAVMAFALLADVRLSYDDPLFNGLTPNLERFTWTLLLLIVEAFCVLVLVLLLTIRPAGSGMPAPTEDWTPQDAVTITMDDTQVQIGCPGCGTIFTKLLVDVDEEHEQDFNCPNCSRPGHLRLGVHRSAHLRNLACNSCEREFTAYRDNAECPHCHAPN